MPKVQKNQEGSSSGSKKYVLVGTYTRVEVTKEKVLTQYEPVELTEEEVQQAKAIEGVEVEERS